MKERRLATAEGARPELISAYEEEMKRGYAGIASRNLGPAFQHFERAHILGQRRTRLHVRAHVAMLRVGWLRRDARELVGQLWRILAAFLFSRIWVPDGNTGGANVSSLEPMQLPEDLRQILEGPRSGTEIDPE